MNCLLHGETEALTERVADRQWGATGAERAILVLVDGNTEDAARVQNFDFRVRSGIL